MIAILTNTYSWSNGDPVTKPQDASISDTLALNNLGKEGDAMIIKWRLGSYPHLPLTSAFADIG